MDNLTLYVNKDEYKVEIDEKFTKVSSLDELEDLEHSLPGFFDVESIGRNSNKIYLVYNLPNGYKSLEEAKLFVPVIKLQILKNILESDPLLEADGMTYLDLNNLFFKSFNDIKILYRSNGYLPYHQGLSNLDQYKLLIFGLWSEKHSYKRFLINKDNLLRKENNEFMFTVNAASSFSDLKTIVNQEFEKEQIGFYEKAQVKATKKKNSFKKKIVFSTIGLSLLGLFFLGAVKQAEKNVAAGYEEKLATAKKENELTLAITSGDTQKAVNFMEEKNDDPETITNMLINAGKYDEAISYNKDIRKDVEKRVVTRLYKLKQQEKILDLKSSSSFLSLEREIISFNSENLIEKAPLITDKDTKLRLVLAFFKHDEFENAKSVLESIKTNNLEELSKDESNQIDLFIKKAKLEVEIDTLTEQITNLKAVNPLEGEIPVTRDAEIKALEEELIESQKKLIKLDEKIGFDG